MNPIGQVRNRAGFCFVHDFGPMNVQRLSAYAKLLRDGLVLLAAGQMIHDFLFARGQRGHSVGDLFSFFLGIGGFRFSRIVVRHAGFGRRGPVGRHRSGF